MCSARTGARSGTVLGRQAATVSCWGVMRKILETFHHVVAGAGSDGVVASSAERGPPPGLGIQALRMRGDPITVGGAVFRGSGTPRLSAVSAAT